MKYTVILFTTLMLLVGAFSSFAQSKVKFNDSEEQLANSLLAIAYDYRLKGHFADAKTVLLNGIEILSIEKDNSIEIASLKLELARVIARENFHNYTKEKNIEALALYTEVEAIAKKENNKKLMAAALYGFGQYHFFLGYDASGGTTNWDTALEHLERSLAISRKAKNAFGVSKSLFLIGTIYQRRREFETADVKYQESLKMAKKAKSVYMEAENERHIGFQHYFRGDKEKALQFLLKSLEKRRSIGYNDGVIFGLNVVSQVYEDLGKLDMAKKYLKESLPLAKAMNSKVAQSRIYNALGRVFYAQKENDKALVSLKKAKEIAGSIGYSSVEKSSQELLNKLQNN